MEQATNQFLKGLQQDTHPMMQGNDTLTDALNATFITMNGNEVALQNDMGNRRIDNAYLPSGYQPVGIKEHGGIIYIAAYNPITNRSQIGSFPSPERKISTEDESDLGGSIKLESLLDTSKNSNLYDLPCVTKDTILVPLTKDTSLHAGDKFVVKGNVQSESDNISNYYNTISVNINGEVDKENTSNNTIKKVISPKNKLYTLSLGILNSQNEFVDITKTLVRWKRIEGQNDELVEYTNESNLYKFNDGYFIAQEFSNLDLSESENDAKLIKERQTLTANTYAYKLVGSLYAKASLNHIQNFSYNIYGIKKNDREATIWIEAFVTYNCPDGVITTSSERKTNSKGDDNYYTYDDQTDIKFDMFDLIKCVYKDEQLVLESEPEPANSTTTSLIQYDPNTNLYNCKIVKEYEIEETKDSIYNYVIGVKVKDGIYLSGLSNKGEINIKLLGSGDVELQSWRFINSDKSSTITYNFNAYPKFGKSFTDFHFGFTPINSVGEPESNNYFEIPSTIYNGRNTLNINWDSQDKLQPNTMYRVTWRYNDGEGNVNSTENQSELQKDRWFLTTELFNDCYSPSSNFYIADYGNPSTKEQEIIDLKSILIVDIDCNFKEVLNSIPVSTQEGTLLSKKDGKQNISFTTNTKYQLDVTKELLFDNIYPNYVQLISNPTDQINITTDSKNIDNEDFINNVVLNSDGSHTDESEFKKSIIPNINDIKILNNTINFTVTNKDKVECTVVSDDTPITDGFASIHDNEVASQLGTGTSYNAEILDIVYGGMCTDYNSRTGPDDSHYLKVNINPSSEVFAFGKHNGDKYSYQYRWNHDSADKPKTFDWSNNNNYKSKVLDAYNNYLCDKTPNSQIFLWAFEDKPRDARCYNSSYNLNESTRATKASRVWMKTSDGKLGVMQKLMFKDIGKTPKERIINYIKTNFTNYKFAFYKNTTLKEIKLYKLQLNKDYIYNNPYQLPYIFDFDLSTNSKNLFNLKNPIDIFSCNIPIFTNKLENEENEYYNISKTFSYQLNIKSAANYSNILDLVENSNSFSNIDIETGAVVDYNKDSLNSRKLYTQDLKPVDTTYLIPTDEFGKNTGTYRYLVFNGNNLGNKIIDYHLDYAAGDSDSTTVLMNADGCPSIDKSYI